MPHRDNELHRKVDELKWMLCAVLHRQGAILHKESEIMSTIDDVVAGVAAETSQIDAIEVLLANLQQEIADLRTSQTDPATAVKIDALAQAVGANVARMKADILANTPEATKLAATVTTLMSSANPSTPGQPVTLSAVVAGPPTLPPIVSATPSGTVDFVELTPVVPATTPPTPDKETKLGTATLSAGGSGSIALAADFPAGSHNIMAKYSGDKAFDKSTSLVLMQVTG